MRVPSGHVNAGAALTWGGWQGGRWGAGHADRPWLLPSVGAQCAWPRPRHCGERWRCGPAGRHTPAQPTTWGCCTLRGLPGRIKPSPSDGGMLDTSAACDAAHLPMHARLLWECIWRARCCCPPACAVAAPVQRRCLHPIGEFLGSSRFQQAGHTLAGLALAVRSGEPPRAAADWLLFGGETDARAPAEQPRQSHSGRHLRPAMHCAKRQQSRNPLRRRDCT